MRRVGGMKLVRRGSCVALLAGVMSMVSVAGAQAALVGVSGGAGPEGTGSNTQATFTFTSDAPAPNGGYTVQFTTQNAGAGAAVATSGQDFLPPSGSTATIPEGQTQTTIQIPVVADAKDEEDQLFAVRITDVLNGGTKDTNNEVANWTIQDDDAAPTVTIADGYEGTSASSPLPEGTGSVRQMTFEVTLSAVSEKQVRVDYDAIPGTAKQQVTPGDDGDYQAPSPGHAPLTINAGSAGGKIFISIIADSRDEVDEQFTVQLSNPQNATIARGTAIGKILDDDGPTSNILDATVTEGASGQTTGVDVTVVLDQASVQDVSFAVTTGDDTAKAPDDYEAIATAQTLTIQAGRLTGAVRVNVAGDDVDEADESFKVKLTLTPTSNASLGDGTAAVTIKDDDVPPALAVVPTSVKEGTGGSTTATVTLTLASPAARKLKVGYATENGTATGGTDYQSTNSTVDFDAGQTSQTVSIPIAADSTLEPDETFVVRAVHTTTDGSNQTVPDPNAPAATGVVTILDDDLDADNTPTLTAGTARVQEGDDGSRLATFTVRLDSTSPRPVTATYATADGTAKAGADYLPASGTVVIPAGQQTATLTVTVLGDRKVEDNEDFRVVLSDVVNARAAMGGGLGIIVDDDAGGGPITLASSFGKKAAGGLKRIPLGAIVCRAGSACPGAPVSWSVEQRGTIRAAVTGLATKRVKRTTGTGKARRTTTVTKVVRVPLFAQSFAVKAGAGKARVRLAPGRAAQRALRRARRAGIRQVEITVTFTNRRGAQQAPTTFTFLLT